MRINCYDSYVCSLHAVSAQSHFSFLAIKASPHDHSSTEKKKKEYSETEVALSLSLSLPLTIYLFGLCIFQKYCMR